MAKLRASLIDRHNRVTPLARRCPGLFFMIHFAGDYGNVCPYPIIIVQKIVDKIFHN
jgi:hypothetical protein